MSQSRTFSDQERRELEAIKERILGRLRQQRAVSELLWDTAKDMLAADEKGLWPLDLPVPEPNKKTGKRRKPTRELWASLVFRMSDRQARRYFRVAEKLRREEVAGTGLCLERMEQLAIAPVEIKEVLRRLGVEGLSARALSAGRRAALPFLDPDDKDVERARRKAEEAVWRTDRREDRQDQLEGPPEPAPVPTPAADDRPDVVLACEVATDVLEEVEAMLDAPLEELDPAQVERLVGITDRLAQGARRVLSRIKPQAASPDGPENRKEASGEGPEPREAPPDRPEERPENRKEASADARAAGSAPRHATPRSGVSISFVPVLACIRALGHAAQQDAVIALSRVVAGRPVAEAEEVLAQVFQGLLRRGVDRGLAENWMALLTQGEWEQRGRFALWFGGKLGDPALAFHLAGLREEDLPAGLRQQVSAYLDECSAFLDRVPGERVRLAGWKQNPVAAESKLGP